MKMNTALSKRGSVTIFWFICIASHCKKLKSLTTWHLNSLLYTCMLMILCSSRNIHTTLTEEFPEGWVLFYGQKKSNKELHEALWEFAEGYKGVRKKKWMPQWETWIFSGILLILPVCRTHMNSVNSLAHLESLCTSVNRVLGSYVGIHWGFRFYPMLALWQNCLHIHVEVSHLFIKLKIYHISFLLWKVCSRELKNVLLKFALI